MLGRTGDFPESSRISDKPVCWVSRSVPVPGAWPLQLWRSTAQLPPSRGPAPPPPGPVRWVVAGGSPTTSNQISSDGQMNWVLNQTLGWAEPLPDACYWGLPSVTFDDPA